MTLTTHGHHIPNSPPEYTLPANVVRCGGPSICPVCTHQASKWAQAQKAIDEASPFKHGLSYSIPDELDGSKYMDTARKLVWSWYNERDVHIQHPTFAPDEIYIVWFSKTLQNWKAMLSTTLPDGLYFEITYNGDKNEAYLDAYKKVHNSAIKMKDK
jgi:hypothetical protein